MNYTDEQIEAAAIAAYEAYLGEEWRGWEGVFDTYEWKKLFGPRWRPPRR